MQALLAADALVLAWIPGKGRGVVAARPIAANEALVRFEGEIRRVERVSNLDHWLQVEADRFLGPSGRLDDSVNHSCQPNCGLFEGDGGPVLTSLQPIASGEEICFDYSTWMTGGHWRMSCACGSRACRGDVDDFETLPLAIRTDYLALGCVPAFVITRDLFGR